MLSNDQNDILTRVGPGTPMGDFIRHYWMPALLSTELPSPDCPPLRLRLLGENLIAFRVTSGAAGIVANSCPHRGASLFFGRNEEEGLRCVYHGWKFDVAGNCVDMPSEPAESNFRSKVKAMAYPCRERGGVIWTYMGALSTPPPLPDLEANLQPEGECAFELGLRECNWMQALEGDIDTVHAAFLHGGARQPGDQAPGSAGYYQSVNRAARFSVLDTDFGTSYGAYREAEADSYYWRIAHFIFPFYTMIPGGFTNIGDTPRVIINLRAWVPLDDSHTLFWRFSSRTTRELQEANGRLNQLTYNLTNLGPQGFGPDYLPPTTDWLGRWRLVPNEANDYLINRESQARWNSYTGIESGGAWLEDQAVTESMGAVYARDQEHLGQTDAMIIRTRRRLINAALALRDAGVTPPCVGQPELYRQRSGSVTLPRSANWWEATTDLRKGFAVRQEVSASAERA